MNESLLNIRELAVYLHCSPRTVYRLRARGMLPQPLKLGKLYHWPRNSINEWVTRGTTQGDK